MAACLSSAFTRDHGGEGYQPAANHPKTNSIPQPPPFLLPAIIVNSSPQNPTICQTKRQSVLWKSHTSFYVINNPPGEQPHQGVFPCSTNQNPKNTCCQPKETLQESLPDNPLVHAAQTRPQIAGKYKKNPLMTVTRNYTTSSHRQTKQPRQANTHQRQRSLIPRARGGGVKKSEGANSLQIRSKDHMTQINHRR